MVTISRSGKKKRSRSTSIRLVVAVVVRTVVDVTLEDPDSLYVHDEGSAEL